MCPRRDNSSVRGLDPPKLVSHAGLARHARASAAPPRPRGRPRVVQPARRDRASWKPADASCPRERRRARVNIGVARALGRWSLHGRHRVHAAGRMDSFVRPHERSVCLARQSSPRAVQGCLAAVTSLRGPARDRDRAWARSPTARPVVRVAPTSQERQGLGSLRGPTTAMPRHPRHPATSTRPAPPPREVHAGVCSTRAAEDAR